MGLPLEVDTLIGCREKKFFGDFMGAFKSFECFKLSSELFRSNF